MAYFLLLLLFILFLPINVDDDDCGSFMIKFNALSIILLNEISIIFGLLPFNILKSKVIDFNVDFS